MKVFFDTSVMVAAVVDQLAQHERAFSFLSSALKKGHECACSTHALAECYATLTVLPLPRRIQAEEARVIIESNFIGRMKVVEIGLTGYRQVLQRVAELGMRSGVIYDALHLQCAETAGYDRLVTFNIKDFERLKPIRLKIAAP